MSTLKDKNRANHANEPKDIRSWLARAFSRSLNVRTEQSCAKPDYSALTKSGITGAETSPASSAPTTGTWDLDGYWGLHGYTVQTGSGSVDLELWAYDSTAEEWFLVETKSTVADKAEFHFDGKVRNRQVFLRVAALNGSVSSVDVHASPE